MARSILKYGLIAIGAVLLFLWLGVVCIEDKNLPANELATQWKWFYGWGFIVSCYGMLMYIFYPTAWQRCLVKTVIWSLITLGIYEGMDGLLQIYGYSMSNHSLYALTGTFYNPGPYSGYLAMVCPIALYEYLQLGENKNRNILTNVARYVALFAFLLCLCVLPSGMSRSAWGAAAGGILVVTFAHFNGKRRLLHYFRTNRKRAFIITSIVLCSVIVAGSGAFYLKKDSANGRLFMWKITCRAIAEKPWLGYWESFPKIYGEAQEKYFAAGDYTEEEARIAGSPEYAFNEYLQITAEWGLLCLALFLSILILCLYGGIKGKKYGICGALCAFSIFAMSSYPLQFPAFWCTLLLMLMACFPNHETHRPSFTCIIGAYLCFNGALLFYQFHEQWSERSVAVEKWNNARLLYNTKAYEAAQTAYEELYKEMHWNFRYLFEYGHTLSKQKQYSEAIFILQKAENESNDPMILNIMGKDFQDMKLYDKAEEFFKRSINRLPSRIYPYYLLAKLYLEPDYYHPEKFKRTAETVLNKQPKVPSPAVEEMKKEIKKLLESEKDTGT